MNERGHDAHFADSGRNHSGTIGTDHAALGLRKRVLDAHHVTDGNAFGDGDDQFDSGINRFKNRIGGEWRRDKDD